MKKVQGHRAGVCFQCRKQHSGAVEMQICGGSDMLKVLKTDVNKRVFTDDWSLRRGLEAVS